MILILMNRVSSSQTERQVSAHATFECTELSPGIKCFREAAVIDRSSLAPNGRKHYQHTVLKPKDRRLCATQLDSR